MADTRKDKLEALVAALERSKTRLTQQQLMDVLGGQAKPAGAEDGVLEAELNQRLAQPAAAAGIMPQQPIIVEETSQPQDFSPKTENLPFTGRPQQSMPLPYQNGPQRMRKLSRLYQLMQ